MKRYYRSREDRKIAGVCGGLADLMNLDPTLVRAGFLVLTIVTGVAPFVIGYVAVWILAPERPAGPERPGDPERPAGSGPAGAPHPGA